MGIGEVGDILFVCPPFFGLKDAYAMPMPVFCPDVDTNQFVANPGKHQFPLDKSIALTRAVAFYYGIKENATHYGSVIEAQNDILRRNAATTALDLDSYLLFSECGCILDSVPNSIPLRVRHI